MPGTENSTQANEWGQPTPVRSGNSTRTPIWAIVGTIVLIAIIGGATWFFTKAKPESGPSQTEAPARTPSPTPIRNVSPVATTSAFLALEQSISTLSANIAATNADDPTLTPPIIELDLGLTPR